MRATRERGATAGAWCGSGWSDVVERQARASAVLQLTARLERATFHAAAPFRAPAPVHQNRRAPEPALGDAPVESRAAVGPHATFDLMADLPALAVHHDQSAAARGFVPAETTDYISRACTHLTDARRHR